MSGHPINIAFFWHMHQPVYTAPDSAVAILPWTRLHALKDYLDMPLWCEETGFPATFNLVPCLIDQIEQYANGQLLDEHLILSKRPVSELSAEEKHRIIEDFFAASYENMISRLPRYLELHEKYACLCGEGYTAASLVPSEDLLDLTVLLHLAWCGESLRLKPAVKALISKGQGFSEENRSQLLEISREWISQILPTYKRLWESGLIDLSVSPYYHPILPLICDTEAGRAARADCALPQKRYVWPQDSAEQIQRAIARFEAVFGQAPQLMWPSEGSVSESAIEQIETAGIRFIATDEAILRKSFPEKPEELEGGIYRPWRRKGLTVLFRDHRLSDKIGFDYSKIPAQTAIEDFLHELKKISDAMPNSDENLVSIVLDGENAWEFFPENGREFLTGLYKRLLSEPWIRPTRITDFIKACKAPLPRLTRLAEGSWIDGDFGTWIGNSEKNRAWDELALAREALAMQKSCQGYSEALEQILVAEGSDWFWWFGRDANGLDKFDELFRSRIEAVYRALNLPAPESLKAPIIGQKRAFSVKSMPISLISPTIDGLRTNFFEWQGAGVVENSRFFGAMHSQSAFFDVRRILFGWDERSYFFQIDTGRPPDILFNQGINFIIDLSGEISIKLNISRALTLEVWDKNTELWISSEKPFIAQTAELIELALPFEVFLGNAKSVKWSLRTELAGRLRELYPPTGLIECEIGDLESRNWIA